MTKRVLIIVLAFIMLSSLGVSAYSDSYAPRLVDNAGLLSESEAAEVLSQLDRLSADTGVDVVVYTTDYISFESATDQADGVFEDYNYGAGSERSCILLYINMDERDWHITTAGYGITAVTDAGLTYISDKFTPYLSDGEYYKAFTVYAEECEYLIDRAKSGDPFDSDDLPKEPFSVIGSLIISLIIGFIASLIIVGKHKAQLKTVRYRDTAKDYTVAGSMAVTDSREIFLYRTVNRTARSSDSGSSTHTTKSGTRVGGGGGKF